MSVVLQRKNTIQSKHNIAAHPNMKTKVKSKMKLAASPTTPKSPAKPTVILGIDQHKKDQARLFDVSRVDDLEEQMEKQWIEQQKNQERETSELLEGREGNFTGVSLEGLLDAETEIETVRKDDVFASEITESEADIIARRVAEKQKQYQEYLKRQQRMKTQRILAIVPFLTEEEAATSLEDCNDDEDEAVTNLTNIAYLLIIRKKIALKANPAGDSRTMNYTHLNKKRRAMPRLRKTDILREGQYERTKLCLDDALKDTTNKEGWSDARIRAFEQIDVNPNAYYYRFNAPNEEQRTGKWTAEEEQLFFQRSAEMGVDGQWGIFSMAIPGRVGYQCSNYYRKLIESGRVCDPNYYLAEDGKAHYKFKTPRRGAGAGEGDEDIQVQLQAVKKRRIIDDDGTGFGVSAPKPKRQPSKGKGKGKGKKGKGKKRSRWCSDDSEDEWDWDMYDGDTAWTGAWTTTRTKKITEGESAGEASLTQTSMEIGQEMGESQSQVQSQDSGSRTIQPNPLPGFIDPITLECVTRPAISPQGIVMDYVSWVDTLTRLEPKNTCPFTKMPLTKRELVILTPDNIEEYRSKIANT